MSDEAATEDEEVVIEVDSEPSELFVTEGEFVLFDSAKFAEDHGALGAAVVGGDVFFLMPDLKLHKVEIIKGFAGKPSGAAKIQSIKPKGQTQSEE